MTWILKGVMVLALASFIGGCKEGGRMEQRAGQEEPGMGGIEAQQAQREPTAAMEEGAEQSANAFRQDAEKKLDQIGERIDELEQSAGRASGESREKLQAMVEELKDKKSGAEEELDELKAASEDSWDQVRERLQATMEDLEEGINEAMASID